MTHSPDYLRDAMEFFKSNLPQDPAIRRVYHLPEGPVVHVFTVIDSPDRDLEDRVYSAEAKIIDQFPNVNYDFHLVRRGERTLPEGATLVFQR